MSGLVLEQVQGGGQSPMRFEFYPGNCLPYNVEHNYIQL